MIKGYAEKKATKEFLSRYWGINPGIKDCNYFLTSPFGLGNHLGDFTDADSYAYRMAMKYGISRGINLLDTAVNYRGMRSEIDTGAVIEEAVRGGMIRREELIVASKAGLLFGDITKKLRPMQYLNQILMPLGIGRESFQLLEDGPMHSLKPGFFNHAIEVSRRNLGVDTIDIHYIHIPEISRYLLGEQEFYEQLGQLFSFYESKAESNEVRFYGMAFEMMVLEPEQSRWHINLETVCQIADAIAGSCHHFRFLQVPLNLTHTSAVTQPSQILNGKSCTIQEAAEELGLNLLSSMPFHMGESLMSHSPQKMIQYLKSLPNTKAFLVGSKNQDHIAEIIDYLH